eukprot:scaffold9308_cov115-Cylindrotheca_fusiformis.AAC.3
MARSEGRGENARKNAEMRGAISGIRTSSALSSVGLLATINQFGLKQRKKGQPKPVQYTES